MTNGEDKYFNLSIYLAVFIFFSFIAFFSYYYFYKYISDTSKIYSKQDLANILCDYGISKVQIEDTIGPITGINCK